MKLKGHTKSKLIKREYITKMRKMGKNEETSNRTANQWMNGGWMEDGWRMDGG